MSETALDVRTHWLCSGDASAARESCARLRIAYEYEYTPKKGVGFARTAEALVKRLVVPVEVPVGCSVDDVTNAKQILALATGAVEGDNRA